MLARHALAARVGAVAAHIAIGEGRLGEAEALATRAVTKDSPYRLQRTCAELAVEVLGLIFVGSQFGERPRRNGEEETGDRRMAR